MCIVEEEADVEVKSTKEVETSTAYHSTTFTPSHLQLGLSILPYPVTATLAIEKRAS